MILAEDEVRRSLECAKAAFPRFAGWTYNNEIDESYADFSLWGEFVAEPDRRFYVTFDNYKATWTGHLTIGQHAYFWSSADFGDAHLLDTSPCATLQEAIALLRAQMASLCAAFLGRPDTGG